MAEYLIQSETLDDIADAINAKTGGSSAMTPAQMVTAINSIVSEALPSQIFKLKAGEFTLAENVTSYTITHGLGAVPQFIFVWLKGFNRGVKDYNKNRTRLYFVGRAGDATNQDFQWAYFRNYSTSGGNLMNEQGVTGTNIANTSTIQLYNVKNLTANFNTSASASIPAVWQWIAISVTQP